jgi:hypothetical protein
MPSPSPAEQNLERPDGGQDLPLAVDPRQDPEVARVAGPREDRGEGDDPPAQAGLVHGARARGEHVRHHRGR